MHSMMASMMPAGAASMLPPMMPTPQLRQIAPTDSSGGRRSISLRDFHDDDDDEEYEEEGADESMELHARQRLDSHDAVLAMADEHEYDEQLDGAASLCGFASVSSESNYDDLGGLSPSGRGLAAGGGTGVGHASWAGSTSSSLFYDDSLPLSAAAAAAAAAAGGGSPRLPSDFSELMARRRQTPQGLGLEHLDGKRRSASGPLQERFDQPAAAAGPAGSGSGSGEKQKRSSRSAAKDKAMPSLFASPKRTQVITMTVGGGASTGRARVLSVEEARRFSGQQHKANAGGHPLSSSSFSQHTSSPGEAGKNGSAPGNKSPKMRGAQHEAPQHGSPLAGAGRKRRSGNRTNSTGGGASKRSMPLGVPDSPKGRGLGSFAGERKNGRRVSRSVYIADDPIPFSAPHKPAHSATAPSSAATASAGTKDDQTTPTEATFNVQTSRLLAVAPPRGLPTSSMVSVQIDDPKQLEALKRDSADSLLLDESPERAGRSIGISPVKVGKPATSAQTEKTTERGPSPLAYDPNAPVRRRPQGSFSSSSSSAGSSSHSAPAENARIPSSSTNIGDDTRSSSPARAYSKAPSGVAPATPLSGAKTSTGEPRRSVSMDDVRAETSASAPRTRAGSDTSRGGGWTPSALMRRMLGPAASAAAGSVLSPIPPTPESVSTRGGRFEDGERSPVRKGSAAQPTHTAAVPPAAARPGRSATMHSTTSASGGNATRARNVSDASADVGVWGQNSVVANSMDDAQEAVALLESRMPPPPPQAQAATGDETLFAHPPGVNGKATDSDGGVGFIKQQFHALAAIQSTASAGAGAGKAMGVMSPRTEQHPAHASRHKLTGRDEMLRRLLAEQARVDSENYATMTLEEVELSKQEIARLDKRVAEVKKKLSVETRIRDAALLLRRSHRRNNSISQAAQGQDQLQPGGETGEAALKISRDVDTANAKVELVNQQLFSLTEKAGALRRALLQHHAAVLAQRLDQIEEEQDATLVGSDVASLGRAEPTASISSQAGHRASLDLAFKAAQQKVDAFQAELDAERQKAAATESELVAEKAKASKLERELEAALAKVSAETVKQETAEAKGERSVTPAQWSPQSLPRNRHY